MKEMITAKCTAWEQTIAKSNEDLQRLDREESFLLGQIQKLQKNLTAVIETKHHLLGGNEAGLIAINLFQQQLLAGMENEENEESSEENDKINT